MDSLCPPCLSTEQVKIDLLSSLKRRKIGGDGTVNLILGRGLRLVIIMVDFIGFHFTTSSVESLFSKIEEAKTTLN